jgi:hypothetical protein
MEDLPKIKTKGQQQSEALDRFLIAMDSLDEPIPEEALADLENNRVNIGGTWIYDLCS